MSDFTSTTDVNVRERSYPLRADFVAEVGDWQNSRRPEKVLKASQLPCPRRRRRLRRAGTDARDAYATHTVDCGGGLATNFASRRRFWAMAASVNSSWAPRGPPNLWHPSLMIRFRWA